MQSTHWDQHHGVLYFKKTHRGTSATFRSGRITERYFVDGNEDLHLNEDGEAKWKCAFWKDLKAPHCFLVRLVEQIQFVSLSQKRRNKILFHKKFVEKSFGAPWREIVETFGKQEAMLLLLEEAKSFGGYEWGSHLGNPADYA